MPKTKLKRILLAKIQANPNFALFQAIQQMREDLELTKGQLKDDIKKEISAEIKRAVSELKQSDPVNAGFIDKIVNKAVAQLIKDTKGDTGEKGEVGNDGHTPTEQELDSLIRPIVISLKELFRGEQGERGETIKGEQGDVGAEGKAIKGEPGKTPKLGVDFLTKKDIQEIIDKIRKPLEEKIDETLKMFQETFDKLERAMRFGSQRTLHRGGVTMYIGRSVGTGNGSTKIFTLPSTPYSATDVTMHVGTASYPILAGDFSVSGVTVTFVNAPPNGANVAVTMQGT